MRILLFNWVPFDDAERRGGGVRVYEKNLIDHLVQHTDHEIIQVSSGLEHDAFDKTFRVEQVPNEYGSRVGTFRVVNSPVLAPGHHAFGAEANFDTATLGAWHEFLTSVGPLDVVQFDSLEGIPLPYLRVHEVQPQAKVSLYLHNYYAVCPQVNLWKRESQHCADYRDGHDCASCLLSEARPGEVLRAHQISRVLRRTGVQPTGLGYKLAYRSYQGLRNNRDRFRKVSRLIAGENKAGGSGERIHPTGPDVAGDLRVPEGHPGHTHAISLKPTGSTGTPATVFRERRERAVELINAEVDVVLATSHRVAAVAADRGIDPELIEVAYIGTRVADDLDRSLRRRTLATPGRLTMSYLGYMRRDKGFYFLVEALEAASDDLLGRLRLVVGAKMVDTNMQHRLEALATRMDDILYVDGYTHEELPKLLAGVDVGLVPVQWEDNLPQVAIEMVAHGLPLITSDRGGAQELSGGNPDFTFEATNAEDLHRALRGLVEGKVSLDDYWSGAMELTTMHGHLRRLLDLYRPERRTDDSAAD